MAPLTPAAPAANKPSAWGRQAGVPNRNPANQARVHPPGLPALSGWNRGLKGRERDIAGSAWRNRNRNFDRNAPWKRETHHWWRNQSGWRLWIGARPGFFFFPAFGYIQAPAEYRHHVWREGGFLPRWFWSYQIEDYWDYGLPVPPYGCAWVWVDRDVALIDLSDGYIIELARDVW